LFTLGSFFENYKNNPHFWLLFCTVLIMYIIFEKKRVGLHLSDFFTNASGHPAEDPLLPEQGSCETDELLLADRKVVPLGGDDHVQARTELGPILRIRFGCNL
jgi:hypothetical protein